MRCRNRSLVIGLVVVAAWSSAIAQYDQVIQVNQYEVACQPAGYWQHRFPAMSRDNDKIAVLSEPNPENEIVSLQVLRILEQTLQLESEIPLLKYGYTDTKECFEQVDAGTRESELGSRETVAAVNTLLSDSQFIRMFPIDARSTYGMTPDKMPSEPEEVLSWSHYHIFYDYQRRHLTISTLAGDGASEVLVAVDVEPGGTHLEVQLSDKVMESADPPVGSCVGIPVPVTIWANRGWIMPDDLVFLLRIGYVSSEDCSIPGEWIARPAARSFLNPEP